MIRRWLTLFIYGIVSAVVVFFFHPLLAPLAKRFGDRLVGNPIDPMPAAVRAGIVACVAAGAFAALAPMHTSRVRNLLSLRYPSWFWACMIGFALEIALQQLSGDSTSPFVAQLGISLLPIVGGALAGMVAASWINRDGNERGRRLALIPKLSTITALSELSDDPSKLDAWAMGPESPVNVLEYDFFGYAPAAYRIARHISDGSTTRAIGLVGPYGSGKTSILIAVETLLARGKNKMLVARAHSWGTSSGGAAAELILRAALSRLSQHVDCLSLADVPSTYRTALDKSGSSMLSSISAILSRGASAESTLQRLDRVLSACRFRMVIFLEDMDRNDLEAERFNEVQALLDRLKQSTKQINFILAIGEQARKHIDFAKLCDRYEVLSELSEAEVARAIKTFATAKLQEYPDDVTWCVDKDHDPIKPGQFAEAVVPRQLVALLVTPRILRATLRIVQRAWPRLHGEVDLLQLLVISALRTAAPSAFQFLMTNVEELRGHVFKDEAKHAVWLKEKWDKAVASAPSSVAASAEGAIDYLFPFWRTGGGGSYDAGTPQTVRTGAHAGPQLLLTSDKVDYWQRIFAEEIDGLRDQEVAQAVVCWKKNHEEPKLFERLLHSEVFGERFGRLVGASEHDSSPLFLSPEKLYVLAEKFHKYFLDSARAAAHISNDRTPAGFFAIWRLIINRRPDDSHVDWVISQLDRTLNSSLRLSLDIEYWWTCARDHSQWQDKARRYMVDQIRRRIEEKGTVWLTPILDPSVCWDVHRLIRHEYEFPIFNAEAWRWIVPTLQELCTADDRYIPHVGCLLSKTVEETAPIRDRKRERITSWMLDKKYVAELIPDQRERLRLLRSLLKENAFSLLDDAQTLRLRTLQQDITTYLESEALKAQVEVDCSQSAGVSDPNTPFRAANETCS